MKAIVMGITLLASMISIADARQFTDANGNAAGIIRSYKTGASARVSPQYAALFQAYINDLERNHGATVRFMGGIRAGHCSSSSEHPCGKALDVCQTGRGVVDHRCNLPRRAALAAIAAQHGLFEGGLWCHSDYGHAQVDVTAAACGEKRIAHKSNGRIRYAQQPVMVANWREAIR